MNLYFSKYRRGPNLKPHIFWAKGCWHVVFHKPQWTHEDFCSYMDARNHAYILNHPPFKRALLGG